MLAIALVNRAGAPDTQRAQRAKNLQQNETRRPEGRRVYEMSVVSERTNVLCLITLRATGDLEFDGLAFFE